MCVCDNDLILDVSISSRCAFEAISFERLHLVLMSNLMYDE